MVICHNTHVPVNNRKDASALPHGEGANIYPLFRGASTLLHGEGTSAFLHFRGASTLPHGEGMSIFLHFRGAKADILTNNRFHDVLL